MGKTLYRKLVNLDSINKNLAFFYSGFKKDLTKLQTLIPEESKEKVETFLKISIEQIPKKNIEEMQKIVMKDYESNFIYNSAFNGEKTIVESLEDLSEINKGIKKILPKFKNNTQNMKVKEIGELIVRPTHLYARGIYSPDNFISNFTYGMIIN